MFKPKGALDITPLTSYAALLPKHAVTTLALNDELLTPFDVSGMKDEWNYKRVRSVVLQPGAEINYTNTESKISYASEVTSTYSIYDKRLKTFAYLIRVNGVCGHNTTNVGSNDSQVDIHVFKKATIRFDGGMHATRIYTENFGPEAVFTVAQKPTTALGTWAV